MQPAIRITGLREVQRALLRAEVGLRPALRAAFKRVAEPIAAEARGLLAQYPGASVGTIGPRVTLAGVAVTQRAGTVTGAHPQFGELQMTDVMIPALEHHADDVEDGAGDALDALILAAGF